MSLARIGLEAYADGHLNLLNIVLSAVVGIVFWTFIFGKLVVKHTARITGYEGSVISSSSSSMYRPLS